MSDAQFQSELLRVLEASGDRHKVVRALARLIREELKRRQHLEELRMIGR